MAETLVIKAKNLELNVVEIVKVARVFNSFLVNYVAIFFVILDIFVYCLWPLYVNTNGGYFYGKKTHVHSFIHSISHVQHLRQNPCEGQIFNI